MPPEDDVGRVHCRLDELLVDLHKDETELIPKIEEAMIGALPLPNGVPILVEARTGNNWLEAH